MFFTPIKITPKTSKILTHVEELISRYPHIKKVNLSISDWETLADAVPLHRKNDVILSKNQIKYKNIILYKRPFNWK